MSKPDQDRLDRVVAEARRNREQREQRYRERALKIYLIRNMPQPSPV
jgi:hypothetical protein